MDVYRIIEELFDKSDGKMDELADEMREIEQRVASLEHDARQPRLAMEADVPADKNARELTEGAAAAVQAKHEDSCSANRADLDPMCLTSFGDDSTGLLALPCSLDNALVGNDAAAPKSCLSPLGCAHQQPPVAYPPPAKPLQRQGSPFISSVFGSAQPRRRILRRCQLNTPCTTAFSGGTSFLPLSGGGLYKQNLGELWYSIQAVLKVVYAPTRFWERRARRFVGRF